MAAAMPHRVADRLCRIAPGMATPFTFSKSSIWKCSPTPNISKIIPTSAKLLVRSWSATNPGMFGPIKKPAAK